MTTQQQQQIQGYEYVLFKVAKMEFENKPFEINKYWTCSHFVITMKHHVRRHFKLHDVEFVDIFQGEDGISVQSSLEQRLIDIYSNFDNLAFYIRPITITNIHIFDTHVQELFRKNLRHWTYIRLSRNILPSIPMTARTILMDEESNTDNEEEEEEVQHVNILPPTTMTTTITTDENMLCVICMTHRRNLLFVPCRHLCCCATCGNNNALQQCPLCRTSLHSPNSRLLVFV